MKKLYVLSTIALLCSATSVFAADAMNSTDSGDSMKKDSMSSGDSMKKDSMSKDGMSGDSMNKTDSMGK